MKRETELLDWTRARVGDPMPCDLCGTPAILRHPITGVPAHKVCHDARVRDPNAPLPPT